MPDEHLVARREVPGEPFDQIDRPMLTARAANRDRQIVAVVARVVGQPARDEVIDIAIHAVDFWNRLEKGDDGGVLAGQRRQRRLVMRIGKTPDVEHRVGVEIPAVTLAVAPGRNLAVLVEAAVRNFVLNQRGIDSTKEFIERQQKLMNEGSTEL